MFLKSLLNYNNLLYYFIFLTIYLLKNPDHRVSESEFCWLHTHSGVQHVSLSFIFCANWHLARLQAVLSSVIRRGISLNVFFCDVSSHWCLMADYINSLGFEKWWYFNFIISFITYNTLIKGHFPSSPYSS